jgi:hypothetical protein
MPQVIEFPPVVGGDIRAALGELVRVCRETQDGDAFKDLRTRLRQAKLWEQNRPRVALRFLGAGGKTIARSPFMSRVADAANDDAALEAVVDRLFELNPLLAKAIADLVAHRAHGKDEIYKHLGSFAYKGKVPSRPDLDSWLQIALGTGVLRQVGIAMAPGPRFERVATPAAAIEVDEFLAEDQPAPEPELPGGDDEAVPASALPAIDSTAVIAAISTSPTTSPSSSYLPPALRHLAAAPLPNPRGRERPVPPSRFVAGFPDDVLDETTRRIGAWWSEAKVPSQAHRPDDFGFDPEAWVEGSDELLYRIAVAAALAFRLDADRDGVVRAFKALDAAGVLADLYHGTVPADLPAEVDARALMLASLAARRCAEVPDLAATLEQKKSAADAFAALDGALGRGLFRIEILWMLRMLGQLGVLRFDDLADYTALPYRLVRDTLFRLGFVDTPYATDASSLAAGSRAARRAAGAADAPGNNGDEVVAAFALAAGCAYDCAHRKTCDFPCRERLE